MNHKIFTAIRCNLLSIKKQVDAPIIGLEIVCSKTQSSRANFDFSKLTFQSPMDGNFFVDVCEKKVCPISSPYAKVMTVLWRDHQIRIPRGVTVRV